MCYKNGRIMSTSETLDLKRRRYTNRKKCPSSGPFTLLILSISISTFLYASLFLNSLPFPDKRSDDFYEFKQKRMTLLFTKAEKMSFDIPLEDTFLWEESNRRNPLKCADLGTFSLRKKNNKHRLANKAYMFPLRRLRPVLQTIRSEGPKYILKYTRPICQLLKKCLLFLCPYVLSKLWMKQIILYITLSFGYNPQPAIFVCLILPPIPLVLWNMIIMFKTKDCYEHKPIRRKRKRFSSVKYMINDNSYKCDDIYASSIYVTQSGITVPVESSTNSDEMYSTCSECISSTETCSRTKKKNTNIFPKDRSSLLRLSSFDSTSQQQEESTSLSTEESLSSIRALKTTDNSTEIESLSLNTLSSGNLDSSETDSRISQKQTQSRSLPTTTSTAKWISDMGNVCCQISNKYSFSEIPRYKMTATPRGKAVVINNEKFKQTGDIVLENRTGTHKDAEKLRRLWAEFHFDVIYYENMTAEEMRTISKDVSKVDHSHFDCLIFCILTHGGYTCFYGSDNEIVGVKEVIDCFGGSSCPTLAGKPKLFLFQSCQGQKAQKGTILQSDACDFHRVMPKDDALENSTPDGADYLISYSTLPGYVSYRCPEEGSWFINSLEKNLKLYSKRHHLLDILTMVNAEIGSKEVVEGDIIYKQIPAQQNTLCKHLFLS